jgi:hypothetical protein
MYAHVCSKNSKKNLKFPPINATVKYSNRPSIDLLFYFVALGGHIYIKASLNTNIRAKHFNGSWKAACKKNTWCELHKLLSASAVTAVSTISQLIISCTHYHKTHVHVIIKTASCMGSNNDIIETLRGSSATDLPKRKSPGELQNRPEYTILCNGTANVN